jgi:5-methylcytosine-specific restriction endonuclease McrA
MHLSTLILNADCTPVCQVPLSATSWQESIKLMFVDRVDVLAEYDDWTVHSPSCSIKVPSVILLRDYVKMRRTVKFSKENIYLRDGYICQYCGGNYLKNVSHLTMDHVRPRYLGGKTNFENICACCFSCNLEKAHYMKMKPTTKPRRPTYWELVARVTSLPTVVPHASWIDYIGWPTELVTVKNSNRLAL